MFKKHLSVIFPALTALVLLSGLSCTRQEQPGGAVTISLSSGLPETRGAAEVRDGSEIYLDNGTPDLILLIFDDQGALAARYPDLNPTPASEVMDEATATDMKIRFTSLTKNKDYTIYALANTGNMSDNPLSEDYWTLSIPIADIDTQAEAEAVFFNVTAPKNPSRMPLTAKGTVSVNAEGNGDAALILRRPVAKVVLRFVNNYGAALTLNPFSISLSNFISSKGYLFPHSPDIPAGVTNSPISHAVPNLDEANVVIPNNGHYEISTLVYPSAVGSYLCSASFTVTHVGETVVTPSVPGSNEFTFTNLPIHNNYGVDVTSVDRNQCLTITVTLSQGKMLSFSFDVGEWEEKYYETVTFD